MNQRCLNHKIARYVISHLSLTRSSFSTFSQGRSHEAFQIAMENSSEDVAGGCEVCVSETLSGICPEAVPVADRDGSVEREDQVHN